MTQNDNNETYIYDHIYQPVLILGCHILTFCHVTYCPFKAFNLAFIYYAE